MVPGRTRDFAIRTRLLGLRPVEEVSFEGSMRDKNDRKEGDRADTVIGCVKLNNALLAKMQNRSIALHVSCVKS